MVMVIHNYQGLKFFDIDVAGTLLALVMWGLPSTFTARWCLNQQCFQLTCQKLLIISAASGVVAMDHDHQSSGISWQLGCKKG